MKRLPHSISLNRAPSIEGWEGAGAAPVLTAQAMENLEKSCTQNWDFPALTLQELAAAGVAREVHPQRHRPICVLAGPGLNGGDGLALARHLVLFGHNVRTLRMTSRDWGADAQRQEQWLRQCGGTLESPQSEAALLAILSDLLQQNAIFVDAIFGLGCRPGLSALPEVAARYLNQKDAEVWALDLPSGLAASSGDVTSEAQFRCRRTFAFGHLKRCHVFEPAASWCGRVDVIPLPLPRVHPSHAIQLQNQCPVLPKWGWDTHKYRRGHVVIRAGTPGMSGAAVLAARGALAAGAGLVTVLTDPSAVYALQSQLPEALVAPWNPQHPLPKGTAVLVVGPGGVSDIPNQWTGPMVADASALGAAQGIHLKKRPQTILTPHEGEWKRLFGPSPVGRVETFEKEARSVGCKAVLLLKGAQTLVGGASQERVWCVSQGNGGLATGGTGDVLAGIIGGLWAQVVEDSGAEVALWAAVAGAWLHGAAADRLGEGPFLASELATEVSQMLRRARAPSET